MDVNAMMQAANIPLVYHNTKLEQVSGGQQFKKYILSDALVRDRKSGIGFLLYGDGAIRTRLFPIVARAFVFADPRALFISLVTLRDIVCRENHYQEEQAIGCDSLFVTNFCTPEEYFPFVQTDRAPIEDFLTMRSQAKRRNYYSSKVPLTDATWWSEGFRNDQQPFIKNIEVGA